MSDSNDQERKTVIDSLRASLAMLCFGLALLAYLIAIDRPHWFALRPATGVAAAMAKASTAPPPNDSSGDARHHAE